MKAVWTRLLPAAALGVTIVACGGDETKAPAQTSGTTPPAAAREGVAGTAGANSASDFVRTQLTLGEKQIGLARLAAERATRPEVKQLGEALLRDHQQAGESLRQAAGRQGVSPVTNAEQLDVERQRLSQLSGAQFEQEYLDEIIADHQRAVTDLETAANGTDATTRQWATSTLPVFRRHLDEARALRKSAK